MNIKRTPEGLSITWRMWLVIFSTAFGIYVSGVVSGYFIASSEYQKKAVYRDSQVSELRKQVAQLPDKTAAAVKEDDSR